MAEEIKDGEIVEEETTETEETDNLDTTETEEDVDSEEEDDKTPELWQQTEEEPLGDVSGQTHIRIKQKLKGRISDRDAEIEQLKSEIEQLKATPAATALKRPKEDDFDTDKEFEAALEDYDNKMAQSRFDNIENKRKQAELLKKHQANIQQAVDSHYQRADELIEKSGIKPEIYKNADTVLRESVDTILPKQGDIVVDQMISLVGDGSEKVLYYLGNNKTALNEFKSLLIDDKTGLKAAIYLGQQKERLTNPKKQTTRAPAPSPQLGGDAPDSSKVKSLKKVYDKAHKARNSQAAYNAKKQAKAAGVDVSNW
jgi:hypothetical protein